MVPRNMAGMKKIWLNSLYVIKVFVSNIDIFATQNGQPVSLPANQMDNNYSLHT